MHAHLLFSYKLPSTLKYCLILIFMTSTSNSRKGSSSTSQKATEDDQLQPAAKCPRCDSFNTKFCYYNNYSLSQPRHFCKTCRRYWTRGGALRNIPIGGGCRKNRKLKPFSSSLMRPSPLLPNINDHPPHQYPQILHSSSSDHQFGIGGVRFLGGISPAIDFQLGSLYSTQVLSSPFTDLSLTSSSSLQFATGSSANSAGGSFNFLEFKHQGFTETIQEMGFIHGGNICSNINTTGSGSSLASSINEELQQRTAGAILYGGEGTQKQTTGTGPAVGSSSSAASMVVEKPQAILFQDLEMWRKLDVPTEWFFGSSFAPVTVSAPCGGGNGNAGGFNGVQLWSSTTDVHHFNGSPNLN